MRKWGLDVEHAQCGIDMQNDLPKILDSMFAHYICNSARTVQKRLSLLESLM